MHESVLKRVRLSGVLAVLIVGTALALQPLPTAHGATITVETTADEYNVNGLCSLREAIYAANYNVSTTDCPTGSNTSIDNIYLVNGAVYTLTRAGIEDGGIAGDLDIINNNALIDMIVNVPGGGSATIRQNAVPDDRVFQLIGSQTQVYFFNLTIEEGATTGNGGGIYNAGRLTLDHTTVRANSARRGGGIYNAGSLTMNHSSAISENSASLDGGGVYNTATMTVQGDTYFLDNTAANHGGGIYNSGGTLTLDHAILQSNTANQRGGGMYNTGSSAAVSVTWTSIIVNSAGARGGGLYNYLGSINLPSQNRILANQAPVGAAIYNQASTPGTGVVNISSSCIVANAGDNADFYNGEAALLDARSNWWGNADGPIEYSPGFGDTTSGNIRTESWERILPSGRNCYGQLLVNAHMQNDSNGDGIPEDWQILSMLNPPTEGYQCDPDGVCYVRMTGDFDGSGMLSNHPRVDSFEAGRPFSLRTRIRANNVPASAEIRVAVRFSYVDGTFDECPIPSIPTGTYDWIEFSTTSFCQPRAETTYIVAVMSYDGPAGTVDFDYVFVNLLR